MKNLLNILLILVCVNLNGIAQPNGGFENWHTEATYQVPDGWQTANFLSLTNPPNPLSAFKVIGSDTHSGFYALKLKTVYVINNPWSAQIWDSAGGAFTGKVNLTPFSYKYGFPYTGRAEKLEFWSKYLAVGNDTAGAIVVLIKWNGTSHDTIAFGEIDIQTTTVYSPFQVNLTYRSTEQPDSATIVFIPSKKRNIARVGSTLYIDDVVFTGWVGIDEQNTYADKVKLFPNPTKGDLNINIQIQEADYVKIFDAAGKLGGTFKIQNNNVKVNTALFAAGIYYYKIFDKENKALVNGKFNVIK